MSLAAATSLRHVLGDLRKRLDMDVALVSHFEDGRRVIDIVDAGSPVPFGPGDSDPMEETYCRAIVDGRLPELVPDTSQDVLASAIRATSELDIGAHVGVPVVLEDGTVYGTLCAYSHVPRPDLTSQAATVMGLVADSVARAIDAHQGEQRAQQTITDRISDLLVASQIDMAYQPIVNLADGRTVSVEALARFPVATGATTAEWFAQAAAVGAGTDLELACVSIVQEHLPQMPGEIDVHVNLSPQALLDPRTHALLGQLPLPRIVVELPEQQLLGGYAALQAALAPLRTAGLRLAVDDAGAGIASMRHALLLQPDLLKLDISLVRGIDTSPAKRSLCQALTGLAHATDAVIVAEGVETASEAGALHGLGVDLAQGYFYARPGPHAALHPAVTGALEPVTDPTAATQVRAVVDALRSTASPTTIAAALNARGLLAPTGRRWHATSVLRELLPSLRLG